MESKNTKQNDLQMIKPNALKPGDTVAVVCLSSGLAGEAPFLPRLHRGIARLKDVFQLNVKLMPHALKGTEYLYLHPEARASDMMEAFLDPEVSAVICAVGGDDAIRLLPHIDYRIIRENPKIFMGYSDSTVNHFMMQKAGVVSFHGPCVMVEFAENAAMHQYTIDAVKNTLFHPQNRLSISSSPQWTSEYLEWTDPENDNIPRTMTEETHGFELLQGTGTAEGVLTGGNLTLFPMFTATEIWPEPEYWQNKILFLETAEDYPTPDQVRYVLRNLAAQGILRRLSGIVVGKPLDEKYYEEYKEVYTSVLTVEEKLPHLPVLYNVNCSHTAPVHVIPYGIKAEINCETKEFTLLEPAVIP